MGKVTKNKIQKYRLKKKMPKGVWLQSVYAIQFDGSLVCIKLIAATLNVQARMDRHNHHKVQCRIPLDGDFDIFIQKGEWIVWNSSILPLQKNIYAGHLIWPDDLFCNAYHKTRKAVE